MAITKEITHKELEYLKLNNIKVHVETEMPNSYITEEAWTSFGDKTYPFVLAESESYGDIFSLSKDKSSIIIKEPVLFEFGGCVHFQNASGTDKTPSLGTRVYKNDKSEARCSQIYWSADFKNGQENTIKYAGTDVSVKNNEYINLQYYASANSGLSFISNSIFENDVACTLYLKVVGLPQFTKKNEKIKWVITD